MTDTLGDPFIKLDWIINFRLRGVRLLAKQERIHSQTQVDISS